MFFVVKEDTLIDVVQHLKEDVGLIHQMPFVCDRDGFPAALEKVRCYCFRALVELAFSSLILFTIY